MGIVNDELRVLLNSDVPGQISKLEESSTELERTAAYCEAFYNQSKNKEEAFNITKKLTLQSLASVAYYVNSLSRDLLRSLDLEAENLALKTSEAQNISQIVAIQREKSARREIGRLTISRNIVRQNKITYPAVEEKSPRYQRTPIDYSLLDGIGHGRQSSTPNQEYGSALNRSGSMASNEYGTYGGTGVIYDHYAGGRGTQTLTRQSIRSTADQYRVPQLIPSTLSREEAAQQQQQIYHHLQRQQQIAQQPLYVRMNSQENNNGTLPINNYQQLSHQGEVGYGDDLMSGAGGAGGGGTILRAQSMAVPHQTIYASHQLQRQQSQPSEYAQHLSGGAGNFGSQYRNSIDSMGDGLPPPPSISMPPHPDDSLPPPPPMVDNNYATAINNNEIGYNNNANVFVPPNYIEKARVVYGYDAKQADELTLVEDSIVFILHKDEDGWFRGVMDGKMGLFPGNYVEPI